MSHDPITEARIDALLAVASVHDAADTIIPLAVETDLMREGVFLSLNDGDLETDE